MGQMLILEEFSDSPLLHQCDTKSNGAQDRYR